MDQFETQVVNPEEAPQVDARIEISEETTAEQQIAQCQDIVLAKLKAILFETFRVIGERMQNLALAEDSGIINNIGLLQTALDKLYQEVQFLTYDAEYGLNDKEDRIAVSIEFKGESMEKLEALQAVTLILQHADVALYKINGVIKGFEETIQEARERLADAELADSDKDQAKHQGTIESRGEKKSKQEKRRDTLVKEINKVLKINPDDTNALTAGAENLLGFLIRNKWIRHFISMEQAKNPEEMMKAFSIEKIIEEPEEEPTPVVPTIRPAINRPNAKLMGAISMGVALSGLVALHYLVNKQTTIKPPIYEYTRRIQDKNITLVGYKIAELDTQDMLMIEADNNFKIIEAFMKDGKGLSLPSQEALRGTAPALTNELAATTGKLVIKSFLLNYKEEDLERKAYRSKKHPSKKGFLNKYLVKVRRTMIVRTVCEGGLEKPFDRPLSVIAEHGKEYHEAKPVDTGNRRILDVDNSKRDLQYRVIKGKDGKSQLELRRKKGGPLFRVRRVQSKNK